jgi:hypothetical protein
MTLREANKLQVRENMARRKCAAPEVGYANYISLAELQISRYFYSSSGYGEHEARDKAHSVTGI